LWLEIANHRKRPKTVLAAGRPRLLHLQARSEEERAHLLDATAESGLNEGRLACEQAVIIAADAVS
jgi:tRNA(Phe) wybutosine-synthesizing methylase Tyw3